VFTQTAKAKTKALTPNPLLQPTPTRESEAGVLS